jgi:hypothetical protein
MGSRMKNRPLFYQAALVLFLFSLCRISSQATVADLLHAQGYSEGKVFRKGGADADFIKVEINGHPFTLLIETGGGTTVISRKAAQKAGLLTARDLGSVSGVNGEADAHASLAQVTSFSIGGVALAPSPVVISNMKTEMDRDGIDFDGCLGLETMKANHAVFGYHPAVFYFQPHGNGAPGGVDAFLLRHGFSRVSLTPRKGEYLLVVSFDGTKAIMILESGSPHTYISEDLANRANLMVDNLERMIGEGADGHDGVVQIFMPKQIAIGPLALPPLPVTAANFAMFVKTPKYTPLADGELGFDVVGQLYSLLDTSHDWLYLMPERR